MQQSKKPPILTGLVLFAASMAGLAVGYAAETAWTAHIAGLLAQ